jgi:5-methylcytosine-specific restriction endonuclease McrA
VNPCDGKQTPVRLKNQEYDELRTQVLRRDNWRCQSCGSMKNLEVHHQEFRSRGGSDLEDNLITLCNRCHSAVHHNSDCSKENGFSNRSPAAGHSG